MYIWENLKARSVAGLPKRLGAGAGKSEARWLELLPRGELSVSRASPCTSTLGRPSSFLSTRMPLRLCTQPLLSEFYGFGMATLSHVYKKLMCCSSSAINSSTLTWLWSETKKWEVLVGSPQTSTCSQIVLPSHGLILLPRPRINRTSGFFPKFLWDFDWLNLGQSTLGPISSARGLESWGMNRHESCWRKRIGAEQKPPGF